MNIRKPLMWSMVYEILRKYWLKTIDINDLVLLTTEIQESHKELRDNKEEILKLKQENKFLNWIINLQSPMNDYY